MGPIETELRALSSAQGRRLFMVSAEAWEVILGAVKSLRFEPLLDRVIDGTVPDILSEAIEFAAEFKL